MQAMLFFILSFCLLSAGNAAHISIDVKNMPIVDVIELFANVMHENIIVNPKIDGEATLHLQHAQAVPAFDLFLAIHGLSKWRAGEVTYVATREELIKYQTDEKKWHATLLSAMPRITKIWQLKYAKAKDLGALLQGEKTALLSSRGRLRVDERTNIICVQDVQPRIDLINKMIKRLDVPVQQIAIYARLASIDSDFEQELGISFEQRNLSQDKDPASSNHLMKERGQYRLAIVKLAEGAIIDVKLSALENAGHAELISTPSLFTANQQTASIEAGEEVPYQEISESGGTAITFKKAVLGLKVTPQVLPGNKVLLQLQINQDRPSSRLVLGVPTISTRQLSTQVLVKTGETAILGGIYETDREKVQQRFPILSCIPIIGWLFKQQNMRKSKRELLIFVTPKIITWQT